MNDREYKERVYAGVLGKLTGVFYGRPIEGWPYEKIRQTFDVVDHYVHREAGTPLIVADDDLAGTFTFFNAVEDYEDIRTLTSRDIGETWLDYVIENKTIFWWGGLGRSTEHTAFLRLKQGMKAPMSGSAAVNGAAVAEQIGAQIFMDAFALMCPNDPEKARYYVKQAASVSHDGIAVESACYIAAMEAMAFGEKNIDRLLDEGMTAEATDRFRKIVDDVRRMCGREKDWRKVRAWLDEAYGYQLYPGNCHVVPNLALIVASLVLGGDDFKKAMNICVSSGWDTDCNGANLGCLNGVRLGLSAVNEGYDFRGPVADRMYQISSDGGACVSDAVIQTRRIVNGSRRLYGREPEKSFDRFSFEMPGSVQGFAECPVLGAGTERAVNGNTLGLDHGIYIETDGGVKAFSTPVMWNRDDRQANYCLTGSPSLYGTQTVHGKVQIVGGRPKVRFYVAYYDFNSSLHICYSGFLKDGEGEEFSWKIPDLKGQTIARIGVECSSGDGKAAVLLRSLGWDQAPERLWIEGSQRNYDVPGFNMTMEAFVSSAAQFSFDSRAAFVISHTEKNGVATTGTGEWKNYSVRSVLKPELLQRFGLVARARGHRRYYGLFLEDGNRLVLVKRKGGEETVLASCRLEAACGRAGGGEEAACGSVPGGEESARGSALGGMKSACGRASGGEESVCGRVPCEWIADGRPLYDMKLVCDGSYLSGLVGDRLLLEAEDGEYQGGGAGFLVDCGTVLAYGFYIDGIRWESE